LIGLGDNSLNAAELFVQCLENEGVTRVFGVPGEENAELMMALDASSIEFVLTRHEQGAAFMAEVHGRLTGEPGVCLDTLGPGLRTSLPAWHTPTWTVFRLLQ
jgi:acetolactate synthase-1/2/3 large subunit